MCPNRVQGLPFFWGDGLGLGFRVKDWFRTWGAGVIGCCLIFRVMEAWFFGLRDFTYQRDAASKFIIRTDLRGFRI